MPNLEILSLRYILLRHRLFNLDFSVNRVKCLEPLLHCTNLRELYLRKNEIEDFGQLEYLLPLKQLRTLWIDENPLCNLTDGSYRRRVLRMFPNLSTLDDRGLSIHLNYIFMNI